MKLTLTLHEARCICANSIHGRCDEVEITSDKDVAKIIDALKAFVAFAERDLSGLSSVQPELRNAKGALEAYELPF